MKQEIVQATLSVFSYEDIYDVADGEESNPLQECNTSLDYIENFMKGNPHHFIPTIKFRPTWKGTQTVYFVQSEGDTHDFEQPFVSLESAMMYAGWRGEYEKAV